MKKQTKTIPPPGFCAVNVPADLMGRLRKEAEEQCRSPERQLEWLLKRHFDQGLRGYCTTVVNDVSIGGSYNGKTIGDGAVEMIACTHDYDPTVCIGRRTVGHT